MGPERPEDIVETLGTARLAGMPLPDLADDQRPATEADGYAVQSRLASWFQSNGQGDVAGYKIGATTAAMQDYLGVSGPAYGRIMEKNARPSPASMPGNRRCKSGVECELAVRMGTDVPAKVTSWTRHDLLGYIGAVMPAIEVVENRYGDFRTRGIGVLVADDFFHKSCVLGEPALDWRDLDLGAVEGRLLVDGAEAETGRGSDVLGHPLEAVVWLANILAAQGRILEAGAIVLTGSMTPLHWLEGFPCHVETVIEGLGVCALDIT